ncbi:MAG TPA: putative metal-binding motif-containing protein [Conexibacter sp.]|nr:putative metal-binding motif-containing protein [Conexibacter sp.]
MGATSAAAFPLPDGGPELGSIGRPSTYPFAMGGGGEIGVADFIAPEAGDPTTDGSGSSCYSDTEGGPSWTFTRTYWYAISPVDPLLFELHTSGTHIALAVYAVADPSAKPTAADRIACVGGPNGTDTSLELPTDPDLTYRFQLGTIGSGPVNSSWDFRAGRQVSNDEQQDAIELPLDRAVLVSNFGASAAPAEPPPDCSPWGQLGSGRSVWFRTTVATPGSLQLELQAMDFYGTPGYLSLFSADGATMLACEIGGFLLPTTQVDEQVQPGTYLARVSTGTPLSSGSPATWQSWWMLYAHLTPSDLDGDGFYQPADCNDHDTAIHPGAADLPEDGVDQDCSGADAVNFDRDGDTYARPADCNDGNAAIHPEADEVLDDGVDQNCDGHDGHRDSDGDGIPDYRDDCPRRSSGGIDVNRDGCRDPFQLVVVAQMTLTIVGDHLHLLQGLTVRSARGAHIVVTCTRHACRRMTFALRRTAVTLKRGFARRFPVGTEVTVAASEPGALGMVKRYRLSPAGVRVTHQWCTAEGRPAKRIACA